MLPILNTEAMREADAAAVALRGGDALVRLAGTAVAHEAQRLLGSTYAKRIVVIAGPGLNGQDGRVAATRLRARGAQVRVIEWDTAPAAIAGVDLVIDAAFGLGCSRPYGAPAVAQGIPVLAVDLPSGVDSDTGQLLGTPLRATVTLALGAFKPAHFIGPAAEYAGQLRFAGLGIVKDFDDGVVEDEDLTGLIESGHADHKWSHALQAFVGSTLMPGAAELVLRGALAAGASMIRLVSRGDVAAFVELPPEVVRATELKTDPRSKCVVAGPGLGPDASEWLREGLDGATCPVVLDADGLDRHFIDERAPHDASWVLTPHEGEFTRLTGHALGADRFEDVRELARATGCVVLLKGPTTVIAQPSGTLRVVTSGTPALATAGSGDVLAGLIAATITRGHGPFEAAALAAHLHGRAGSRLPLYASASDVVTMARHLVHELSRAR